MSKVRTNKMMVGNHQSKRIDATLFNQQRAGAVAKAEWLAADRLANPEKYKRSRKARRSAGVIAAGLAVTGAGPLNTGTPRSTAAPSTFAAPYGQKR